MSRHVRDEFGKLSRQHVQAAPVTLHPEIARRRAVIDHPQLVRDIKQWSQALGFQRVGISDIDLGNAEGRLESWLRDGLHGEMAYMSHHR